MSAVGLFRNVGLEGLLISLSRIISPPRQAAFRQFSGPLHSGAACIVAALANVSVFPAIVARFSARRRNRRKALIQIQGPMRHA